MNDSGKVPKEPGGETKPKQSIIELYRSKGGDRGLLWGEWWWMGVVDVVELEAGLWYC